MITSIVMMENISWETLMKELRGKLRWFWENIVGNGNRSMKIRNRN
jgi:hypothetical protein